MGTTAGFDGEGTDQRPRSGDEGPGEIRRTKVVDGLWFLQPRRRRRRRRIGDVVLVHGLGGSSDSTWTTSPRGSDRPAWPSWLAEDCPDWRVWLADAPTALSPWFGSSLACTDAANNLLMRLRIARLGQRPVAWIGHSLGGLLIKALLLEAQTQPLSRKTRGVIFMGTPHWGSAWATRGLWLAHCSRWWLRWLRSAPLLHELRAESPGLRDLHTRYRRLAAARRWRHRSFSEQPLRWLGSIVPPSSADVGLADNDSIPVAADHLTLCKPASRMSIVYRGTVDFLEQLAA